MVFTLNASCGSFIGNGRNNNEDNFYFNKKHLPVPNKGLKNPIKCKGSTDDPIVFALFDGMGGECKGEEASCLASEVFAEEFKKLEEIAESAGDNTTVAIAQEKYASLEKKIWMINATLA